MIKMVDNERFDIKKFTSPDVSCAPAYVWVWNDVCSKNIIDAQLEEMQRLGIRVFYILPEPKRFRPDSMPTNLTPDYPSAEYFELCAYAIENGGKLGMQCWLYDEGGWPSGGACGSVLASHPEYARQTLEFCERSFSAGEVYKTTPDVLAGFLNENKIIKEGYKFSEDTVVTEYFTEKRICGNADYPDLFNKNATEYFIEITHEKYAQVLKNALGKNVTAVFTDEPKAPSGAFNEELMKEYEALYGESIIPYLPLLAEKVLPTEENIHVLYRWYDLCSQLFCRNFLLPCKEWSNEHGMAFTGHMDMDHSPVGCIRGGGNFNLMRALRCFDIPGIDVIRRQLYPENKIKKCDDFNGYNGFFPRYASSAAAQNGTKLAMSEIMGVAGTGISYDIMRYTVGYQAVRGVNIFNLFNFPLGRKEMLLAQELPVFTENQPYYRFLSAFNRYVERLSYIYSLGERVCQTGLYYPVHDFHGGVNTDEMSEKFNALGRTLEDMMVDFDIVDDDVIQCANGIEDGSITVGGASYKHIIIPEGAFVPEKIQEILNCFVSNGGKVSCVPFGLTPVCKIDGDGLRAMHRKTSNEELFCLFREKGEEKNFTVHLPSSTGYLLDLVSGTLQHFEADDGILQLSLSIGETAIILLTNEEFEVENLKNYTNKFRIPEAFVFRKENELICNENGFEIVEKSDESKSINLGDWSHLNGESFSGSGIYEVAFAIPSEKVGKEGEIDLGDVHFAAQVYLNGQYLGACFMSEYRLKIPAGVLDVNNNLKIIVTNTSANWYSYTDYFDKWQINELSPYFEAEKEYSECFVSGGLYGPVTLYTE